MEQLAALPGEALPWEEPLHTKKNMYCTSPCNHRVAAAQQGPVFPEPCVARDPIDACVEPKL